MSENVTPSMPVKITSKPSNSYLSNVICSDTLRKIQKTVLEDIHGVLVNSFGPHGSNTCIKKLNALNMYTKDGHTILCNLQFSGIVEESIRSDIESITKHIVDTVGDGTTSAVILSDVIFKYLVEYMDSHPDVLPADLVRSMEAVGQSIKKIILNNSKECTLEDIYNIAYISANGDSNIATMIADIYQECGMGVFIDVGMTTANETSIKYFDGMTIGTGYSDSCFVTNRDENSAEVDRPEIYFFEDPIDNKEMGVFLDAIISRNIITPIQEKNFAAMVPTVIVAPKISRDMSSLLDILTDIQTKQPIGNKLPIVLITNTHQHDEISDVCRMCGSTPIHKYIDAELYKKDAENGLAPTPETVFNWAGSCEQVVAYSNKSKFINPDNMKDADGEYTLEYKNLLDFLETQLSVYVQNGEDAHSIGTLKRRIQSLKSNLVEIHMGGMTVADRDSARHLVEDAVKNCRSASSMGVGWAANFSGLLAVAEYLEKEEDNTLKTEIAKIIHSAYSDLITILYVQNLGSDEFGKNKFGESVLKKEPFNLRTRQFDGKAVSSIESDVIILESVLKIIGIMVTCNQFMTPTPQLNMYSELREVK